MFQTLWLLLAYSYNIILVLFIAIHLFVGAIISFLVGLYIGIFLSQNYEIPRINEPRTLWEKFLSFLETNRRDPEKISMSNLLRPSTMKELVMEEKKSVTKKIEAASVAATTASNETKSQPETDAEENLKHDSLDDKEVEEDPDAEATEYDENPDMETLERESSSFASRLPSINTTLILSDNELEEYERELEATSLADNFKEISPLRSTLESGYR